MNCILLPGYMYKINNIVLLFLKPSKYLEIELTKYMLLIIFQNTC